MNDYENYETYKLVDEWYWRGKGDYAAHSSIFGFSSEEAAASDAESQLQLFIYINDSLKSLED